MVHQILPPTLILNFNVNDRQQLNNSISRLEALSRFTRFAGPVLWKALPSQTLLLKLPYSKLIL